MVTNQQHLGEQSHQHDDSDDAVVGRDASDKRPPTDGREETTRSDERSNRVKRAAEIPNDTDQLVEGRWFSEEDTQPQISKDAMFQVLRTRRRRALLEFLRDVGGRSTIGKMAEYLAAEELGKPVRRLSSDERKRVYINLYQCHLPKMDSAGVIDFDKNRGTIRLREEALPLFRFLRLEADDSSTGSELSVSTYILAANLLMGAVVVGAVAGAPVLDGLPALWLLLSVNGVALVATAWSYLGRRDESR